jgi:hypothetical protein
LSVKNTKIYYNIGHKGNIKKKKKKELFSPISYINKNLIFKE